MLGKAARIESAGSHPSKVNRFAITAMREVGIDLSSHHSKSVEDLEPAFREDLNYVITLCAEEVCPVILSKAQRLHWPMPDPAKPGESDEAQLAQFRETRDAIASKILQFAKEKGLPLDS